MVVELVVLSGKGGTGKTSLVGSLAALSENKLLVDCDVDAADLHLIVGAKIGRPRDFTASSRALINKEKCTACGICLDYCRFDAIKSQPDQNVSSGERFWVDEYSCEGCGVCRHFCPEGAIDFRPVVSGRWFISRTKYGTLIHARLGIAEGNSGKLVSLLRGTAKSVAESEGRKLIIIDGPPGIGCPVIASLTGADYVLIVTEPSKSAFHDMERIVRLISHFNIPMGLCINKFDINVGFAGRMEEYAAEKGITVLARIPYDALVTRAQVAGIPFIKYTENNTSRAIRSLWRRLQNELTLEMDQKVQGSLVDISTNKIKYGG